MNLQLSGGGLDSIALFLHLVGQGEEFQVLHLNYGQKAFLGERRAVEFFCNKYRIPILEQSSHFDLSSTHNVLLKGESATVGDSTEAINQNRLECRNMVLLSYAASLVASHGGGKIYVAYHQEPAHAPFPDAGDDFRIMFNALLHFASNLLVVVEAPFRQLTRESIFYIGCQLDTDYLLHSFTCYESEGQGECGKCAHCIKKQSMLRELREKGCVE